MTGQFQEGVTQGIEIGKEQGIEFANRENARKMKAKGLELTLIAEISGLSEAELLTL